MRLILVVLILLAVTSVSNGKEIPFNAEWLERGCLAILEMDTRKPYTKEQEVLYWQTTWWINGFFCGVASTPGLVVSQNDTDNTFSEYEKKHPILTPPKEWIDPTLVASKMLAYIKENKNYIPKNAPAARVMTYWYLSAHPKSDTWNKTFSSVMLKQLKTEYPENNP